MKINELEDLLGVSRATIRYYEEQGLVTPPRMENGYRDYGDAEVQTFQKIIVLRKLGIGIPEIRELIDGTADLQDVLARNVACLRAQQDEIAASIELCNELEKEATDFASIDSPKYLKRIYEDEQKGTHFAETKEISFRQLNLAITLLGALAGVPVPQNKLFSDRSHDPIPDDIRGNKKEGDEYDTIGSVLKKGGKRKIIIIVLAVLFTVIVVLRVFHSVLILGGLGFTTKYISDYNSSGITVVEPGNPETEEAAKIDPEIASEEDIFELFKYHTKGGLLLTLKVAENGAWTDIDKAEISAKEGYLLVTGDPSSALELHIIANGRLTKYTCMTGDNTYKEEDTMCMTNADQVPLNKEQVIELFFNDDEKWSEVDDRMNSVFDDLSRSIVREPPLDGCYAVFARDMVSSASN